MWLKNRLYFIQKIDKKTHKCCSTLTAKYSECSSVSISLNSQDFVLSASQSASNFLFHFSRYRSKNHEDNFSQIAELTPKISLEGCLPYWLLFRMAEKACANFFFTVLSAFYFVLLIETLAILTFKDMLCFASISFPYMEGRGQKIGLQYVGSSGLFTGHWWDSLFSFWPENGKLAIGGERVKFPGFSFIFHK